VNPLRLHEPPTSLPRLPANQVVMEIKVNERIPYWLTELVAAQGDKMDIFNFQDLTGEFSVLDVILAMLLSFLLSTFIGWIYKITHRGTSYTQSFVFTLVLNGMVVALVMMVVGSNLARAFSLVGALSIIRFRNAVKETRDVGFIFFTMAIGVAPEPRSGSSARTSYQKELH
jgi:hypothetical protein